VQWALNQILRALDETEKRLFGDQAESWNRLDHALSDCGSSFVSVLDGLSESRGECYGHLVLEDLRGLFGNMALTREAQNEYSLLRRTPFPLAYSALAREVLQAQVGRCSKVLERPQKKNTASKKNGGGRGERMTKDERRG